MLKSIYITCCLLLMYSMVTAQINFSNATEELGLDHFYQSVIFMGGGCAFFDMNQDGWDDLWINGGNQSERFYLNNGDGSFTDNSMEVGLDELGITGATAVITGDLNNDGHREVFICTGKGQPNQLLLNTGNGSFESITESAGFAADSVFTMSASFADVNLDGYLDIYVGNYIETLQFLFDGQGNANGFDHDCYPDEIYINNGDLSFTKQGSDFLTNQDGCVLASTFSDYDRDGDADLMIANDFGEWITPNRLFQNNYPENNLTEIAESVGADPQLYGMGIAMGDYDLDQDLDYYITNLGRNVLLQQNDGTFTDVTADAQVEDAQYQELNTVGWGTSFEDLDLDMYPDLIVVNGYIEALDFIETNPKNPNRIYHNNQIGGFTDVTPPSGFFDSNMGRGLACGDPDNDGDIDLLLMNINGLVVPGEERNIVLYRNEAGNEFNFIKVSLEGSINNRDAFGSQVEVHVGDHVLIRELNGGSSHASQNSSVLHFGLSTNTTVDSITVHWPGGKRQRVYDPAVNQRHHIVEDPELFLNTSETVSLQAELYPVPAMHSLNIKGGENAIYSVRNDLGQRLIKGTGSVVQISALHAGRYLLEVEIDGLKSLIPFVKI